MTTKKKFTFEIGGVCVTMTQEQADRWNSGSLTASDLRSVCVAIPYTENGMPQCRHVTLRRATNHRLEPETASMMDGCSANLVGNINGF